MCDFFVSASQALAIDFEQADLRLGSRKIGRQQGNGFAHDAPLR
jgi:hypothetical protein